MNNRYITIKDLCIAWVLVLLLTVLIVLGVTVNYWYFIAVNIVLIIYEIFIYKVLRCPNCNRKYSLIRLTCTINKPYQCKCGNKMTIQK